MAQATNKKEGRKMRTIRLKPKQAMKIQPNQWLKVAGHWYTVVSVFNGSIVLERN